MEQISIVSQRQILSSFSLHTFSHLYRPSLFSSILNPYSTSVNTFFMPFLLFCSFQVSSSFSQSSLNTSLLASKTSFSVVLKQHHTVIWSKSFTWMNAKESLPKAHGHIDLHMSSTECPAYQ